LVEFHHYFYTILLITRRSHDKFCSVAVNHKGKGKRCLGSHADALKEVFRTIAYFEKLLAEEGIVQPLSLGAAALNNNRFSAARLGAPESHWPIGAARGSQLLTRPDW
jgi:hypothetical protein